MLYKNFAEKLLRKAIDLRECSKATEDEAMWHTSDEINSLVLKMNRFYQAGNENSLIKIETVHKETDMSKFFNKLCTT